MISGPSLDILSVWQSDTDPFCENYAKLYFDAKHLEKRLNRGGEVFAALSSKNVTFFANIGRCPNFLD